MLLHNVWKHQYCFKLFVCVWADCPIPQTFLLPGNVNILLRKSKRIFIASLGDTHLRRVAQ